MEMITETHGTNGKEMIDVSKSKRAEVTGVLDQVGMSHIEMPLNIQLPEQGPVQLPARIDAYVNIRKPEAKGIHMSRLYLALRKTMQAAEGLTAQALSDLLQQFVAEQEGLSDQAYFKLETEVPQLRSALKSSEKGWRHYPVTLAAELKNKEVKLYLQVVVTYSSTCPCSAAMSQQDIANEFSQRFAESAQLDKQQVLQWLQTEAITATPHAQRSEARITVQLAEGADWAEEFLNLINGAEECLGTPVQAAVKRVDELEFARLNAQNLLFCEDANRRLQQYLKPQAQYLDYKIRVDHYESLHPHDASSESVKGVSGGLTVDLI